MRRVFAWFSATGLGAGIALLDHITQGELAFTMLLVPLLGVFSWAEGALAGTVFSAAVTAYWTYSDVIHSKIPAGDLTPYVNGGVRFCVLAFSAYVIAQLREHLEVSVVLRVKDPGTGLLNETGLSERLTAELARAIRRKRPVSAVIVRISGAQSVALDAGDEETDGVIQPVAEELMRQVRRCDITARLSGDDLVAVLPETDAAGAHGFCSRATQRLSAVAESAGVTVSISTISWAHAPGDAASLLKTIECYRASDAPEHIDA
jgi:diguanylate cyclase (GGDEF)-like protein